jgi:glycosyltransferase involved in cell wall biosynthesis
MKVLWICALPLEVERTALENQAYGAQVAASWIVAHFPPPPDVELHIACLWPGGNRRETVEYEGAKVHLLPCPKRGRSLLLFQRDTTYFRSLFNELRPDVVHGWGTEDSFGLVARRLAPARHVIEIQGLISAYRKRARMGPRSFLTALAEKWTLAGARNVVTESEYSAQAARALCPSTTRFTVIEHPLRREFLEAAPSDGLATTALFVGLIQQRKGAFEAIDAFSRVAPLEWKLHFVGGGTPEEEGRMHQMAKAGGIDSRFRHSRILDAQELVRAMQESSVFLLPTHVDTGPTALKEALTMGLWPVCYDNSGPGEYLRKYHFGSLARDDDFNSLSAALKECIANVPWREEKKRLALARQTRIDFSPEQAWSRLSDLYRGVLLQ